MQALPRLILVTGTVQSIGASVYAFALASALGPRPAVLRASCDPLAPIVSAYLARLRNGQVARKQNYQAATLTVRDDPADVLAELLDQARDYGSSSILWDLSGPIKHDLPALTRLAAAIPAELEPVMLCAVGVTPASRRHAEHIGRSFPGMTLLVNPLIGSPSKGLDGRARTLLPQLSPEAVVLLSNAIEPLDVLTAKATIPTVARAGLRALEHHTFATLPMLLQRRKELPRG